jgi:tetratricopeptide (TPR) repeat protein
MASRFPAGAALVAVATMGGAMLAAAAPAAAQYKSFEAACAAETDPVMVEYACSSYLSERTASGRKLAWAHANRGWALYNITDYDAALAPFEAALKVDPRLAYALYGRGMTRLKRGDTAGGNADIAAATKAQPDIARQFQKPLKQ